MPLLRILAKTCIVLLLVLAPGIELHSQPAGNPLDQDLDGLPDSLEQALLERFAPEIFLSELECDGKPARFVPGSADPVLSAKDATLYGQAFPHAAQGAATSRIELHFYHLWERDCGRFAHDLDVEHVSVLLIPQGDADDAGSWRAQYWYAAAHEDTVCDVSHGAHAKALDAETEGARIWISRGKHASYLSSKRCKLGCGGDECKRMHRVKTPAVVNVGEKEYPLNGAVWIRSPRWAFAQKMGSDFGPAVIAQFESANPKKIVAINSGLPPVRATILAGGETLDGVATGKSHTGSALKTGKEATGNALGRAFRAVGSFLNGDKSVPEAARASADEATPDEKPNR